MITNYKVNQPFTSNFSVEEGEKNSSCTWKHKASSTVNNVETFLHQSQKSQWKENHTVAKLWKPIFSGLDRFLSGSLQRKPFAIIPDKVFKPANKEIHHWKILWNRDWFLSQRTSIQFLAKTLKSSMQRISLVWIL